MTAEQVEWSVVWGHRRSPISCGSIFSWVGNTNPEYEKSIALYQGRVDRAEFPSPAASRNRCKSDHPGSFCESTTDQHVRCVKGVGLPEMSMDFSIFLGETAATSPKAMFWFRQTFSLVYLVDYSISWNIGHIYPWICDYASSHSPRESPFHQGMTLEVRRSLTWKASDLMNSALELFKIHFVILYLHTSTHHSRPSKTPDKKLQLSAYI